MGQTVAEMWGFLNILKWWPPPSWIFDISKFLQSEGAKGSNCIKLLNFVAIG